MLVLAVFGIWRNNLFSLTSNWPWSVPLAGLNLLGEKFKRTVLVHVIVFAPLLAFQALAIFMYGYADHLNLIWYVPLVLPAIAIINVLSYRLLKRKVLSA